MKTELMIRESLERERSAVFPQDMSERTLLAVSHSRNCAEALEKQIPKKFDHRLVSPEDAYFRVFSCICQACGHKWGTFAENEKRCLECGQAQDWGS